jgi:hypothetical protein
MLQMEKRLTSAVAVVLVIGAASEVAGQSLRIGIIDFYGLRHVSESRARSALTVKEGDTVLVDGDVRPPFLAESERALALLPGVLRVRLNLVCCDDGAGIIYAGVEEEGASIRRFREAPRGRVRLAPDVVQAGAEFSHAVFAAVQRGDATEDDSQGHALMRDPTARAIQERFIEYARDLTRLRAVLRHSSDEDQRALAAQILGYASRKADIIDDLVYGTNDPSATVRNNAMRALAVIASASPRPMRRIPIEPFVGLLNSPVWTDRNKASLALLQLSARRNPELLATLRNQAMESLVEMARWKSKGHATPALMILGRIGGWSDENVLAAAERGEREGVINAALNRR